MFKRRFRKKKTFRRRRFNKRFSRTIPRTPHNMGNMIKDGFKHICRSLLTVNAISNSTSPYTIDWGFASAASGYTARLALEADFVNLFNKNPATGSSGFAECRITGLKMSFRPAMLYISGLSDTSATNFAVVNDPWSYSIINNIGTGTELAAVYTSLSDYRQHVAGKKFKKWVGLKKYYDKFTPPIKWMTYAGYQLNLAAFQLNQCSIFNFNTVNIPNGTNLGLIEVEWHVKFRRWGLVND